MLNILLQSIMIFMGADLSIANTIVGKKPDLKVDIVYYIINNTCLSLQVSIQTWHH